MKKIIYGTTALLAAGVISTAANAAEPIKLQLGGFADWMVGYADLSGDFEAKDLADNNTKYNSVDVRGDVEIHFNGETQLDNGLKVGVHVELEGGQTTGETVDDSYMYAEGGLGRVILGSTYNASTMLHVSAPDVGGLGVDETNLQYFMPIDVDGIDATYSYTDVNANKIIYVSPSINGASLAVSYSASSDNDGGNEDVNTYTAGGSDSTPETWAFSGLYAKEFGEVGFTGTAGYAQYTQTGAGETVDDYNAGVEFTYAGYTFGGAYRVAQGEDATGDATVWNVGLAYEAGPYGVSAAYMQGEQEQTKEYKMAILSGKYNLGEGVDSFASLGYATSNKPNEAEEARGWAFVTGLQLAF